MSARTVGLAVALASVLASPAFAKSAIHFASAPQSVPYERAAPGNRNVYVDGHYVGTDPDPFIRNELARDWCTEC